MRVVRPRSRARRLGVASVAILLSFLAIFCGIQWAFGHEDPLNEQLPQDDQNKQEQSPIKHTTPLLKLDKQVSEFYMRRTYKWHDEHNVTFEEQLLESLIAIRHTVVVSQLDYYYSERELADRARGDVVYDATCREQLATLVEYSKIKFSKWPLGVVDFFHSYGRVEPAVLPGNFFWWGSDSSCMRARIERHNAIDNNLDNSNWTTINGRMCIGHLRAKSWPTNHWRFGDRLNIKVGICVPEPCHTAVWLDEPEVRRQIDRLGRFQLTQPFNDPNKYEISYLYCIPDQDSELRQWDLGTKLFIVFLAFWASVLIYSNVKYSQRQRAVRRLREAVDIKMTLSQRRHSTGLELDPADSDEDYHLENEINQQPVQNQQDPQSTAKQSMSGQGQPATGPHSHSKPQMDIIESFSLQANIEYLFKSRSEETEAKSKTVASGRTSPGLQKSRDRLSSADLDRIKSHQLSAAARRISSSNEALIKELDGSTSTKSKVTIISSGSPKAKSKERKSMHNSQDHLNSGNDHSSILNGQNSVPDQSLPTHQASAHVKSRRKRVNIDVFDGIKAISTCYIVYGHTMMFFFGFVSDIKFGEERMMDFVMISLINTLQVVGLFYIITGTLVSYLVFLRQHELPIKQPSLWLLIVVGRYIRLLPTYLLVFWFARHVAPFTTHHTNSYDLRTDMAHPRTICGQQSWFSMITMSAADHKIPTDCVPQAWYLSNDFRTLMVLPVYVILLTTNARAGYAAIGATFIASTIRLVSVLKLAEIDYSIVLMWQPHVYALMADRLHDVYTDLITRLSSYLLGIMLGHMLYLYETRQIRRWPSWFQRYGMKVALSVAGTAFFGAPILANPLISQFLPDRADINSDVAVWLIPLFKVVMELSISVMLILIVTSGGYSWAKEALSSRPAKIFSNISYGVFLVHVEIMYKIPPIQVECNYWYLFLFASFFITLSNIVSFFIYILYEMPINNVIRGLIKRILGVNKRE